MRKAMRNAMRNTLTPASEQLLRGRDEPGLRNMATPHHSASGSDPLGARDVLRDGQGLQPRPLQELAQEGERDPDDKKAQCALWFQEQMRSESFHDLKVQLKTSMRAMLILNSDEILKALQVLTDERNYPVAFGCIAGKDRTGLLACLVQSALGVDDEESACHPCLGRTPSTDSELALERRASLQVCFCLVPKFLGATLRHFDFMLRGLEETSKELSRLNIGFLLLKGESVKEVPKLLRSIKQKGQQLELGEGAGLTRMLTMQAITLRWPGVWERGALKNTACKGTQLKNQIKAKFHELDVNKDAKMDRNRDDLVQFDEFVDFIFASDMDQNPTLRAHVQAAADRQSEHRLGQLHGSYSFSWQMDEELESVKLELSEDGRYQCEIISQLGEGMVDRETSTGTWEVSAVEHEVLLYKEGMTRMVQRLGVNDFGDLDLHKEGPLSRHFASLRNDPTQQALSGLSPWIKFGQISAQRCALTVKKAKAPKSSVEAFLDEAIVRRELSDNFCWYNEHYDSLKGAAAWAVETLNKHRKDQREYLYSRRQLEEAKTHDELWNAAQRQMVLEGKMHGFLRMYWAKKVLEWSKDGASALATAIYLNDRYNLDGRDPNGYVGCMWSICGVILSMILETPDERLREASCCRPRALHKIFDLLPGALFFSFSVDSVPPIDCSFIGLFFFWWDLACRPNLDTKFGLGSGSCGDFFSLLMSE
eukprot:g21512.t1